MTTHKHGSPKAEHPEHEAEDAPAEVPPAVPPEAPAEDEETTPKSITVSLPS